MRAQLDDAGRLQTSTKQLDLSISPALMARADESGSNRCWGVKHSIFAKETPPGAWLSSRSTLAAA